MPIDLPKPVADYVAAGARLDLDAMLQPFAPDATLVDNGATFRGLAELRKMFTTEVLAVGAVFTPDNVHHSGTQIILEGPTRGDFPGSPIRFTYRFTLQDDAITVLEIAQ